MLTWCYDNGMTRICTARSNIAGCATRRMSCRRSPGLNCSVVSPQASKVYWIMVSTQAGIILTTLFKCKSCFRASSHHWQLKSSFQTSFPLGLYSVAPAGAKCLLRSHQQLCKMVWPQQGMFSVIPSYYWISHCLWFHPDSPTRCPQSHLRGSWRLRGLRFQGSY